MPGVAVVTDSTSSFATEQASQANLRVIPLQVVLDGRSRPESEVGAAEVAAALRAGRSVSTSRPTPQAIGAAYAELAAAGHTAVVSVHLSAEVSGTVQAAEVAAATAPLPVRVVDSRVLGMATGFAALAGVAAARQGADAETVAALVVRRAAASSTFFSVDDLVYLRRGGRIGAAAAAFGTALAVKPLLTVTDGRIRPYERVRTAARALARLEQLAVDALADAAGRGDGVDVAVHHLDNPDAAAELAAALQGRVPAGAVVVAELSAVLGVHVGPGTLGVVVSPAV
nr:DegV family protein [uncultured Friedmanniella sp.]